VTETRLPARNQSTLSLWMTIKAGAIWTVPNKNQELFVPFHFCLGASCLIVWRSTTSEPTTYRGDWMLIGSGMSRLRNIESKEKVDKDIYDVRKQRGWDWTVNMHINKKMEGRKSTIPEIGEKNTDDSIWLNVIKYVFRLRYIIRH
jgi:hypothetical protein